MRITHLLKFAGLTLMLLACEPPREPKKRQADASGARVVFGAQGQSISRADSEAIKEFRDFTRRWNRAATPFVRDYLDPSFPADRWVREASQHIKKLRSVYTEMYARTFAVEDVGIRGTLEKFTANFKRRYPHGLIVSGVGLPRPQAANA